MIEEVVPRARPHEHVALVTGGGKGIGRAIALALAARGIPVVVTGREERALGDVVGEIANGGGKGRHLSGDVRDPAHLAAAVRKATDVFGRLDLVVANAWVPGGAIFETNLVGVHSTFLAGAAAMAGGGRLVAIVREHAFPGAPDAPAHAACREGVLALVRAFATDLAPRRIACDALLAEPGAAPEEIASRIDSITCTSRWSSPS